MEKKVMMVRITGCSGSGYWYKNKIGIVYKVRELLTAGTKPEYLTEHYALIDKDDCEPIPGIFEDL